MNYRHVFHAGNFADVFKHAVLTRILLHLNEKPQPYRVIDTHAGAGLYDLTGTLANRTGEWRDGIGRLMSEGARRRQTILARNLLSTRSPRKIAAGKLRAYPGLAAVALSRDAAAGSSHRLRTRAACRGGADRAICAATSAPRRSRSTGSRRSDAYLPPAERRGLVLIDPPFEDKDEFSRLVDGARGRAAKMANRDLRGLVPDQGRGRARVREKRSASSAFQKSCGRNCMSPLPQLDKLTACGLLIVNPPWRLASELDRLLPELVELAAQRAAALAIWQSRSRRNFAAVHLQPFSARRHMLTFNDWGSDVPLPARGSARVC